MSAAKSLQSANFTESPSISHLEYPIHPVMPSITGIIVWTRRMGRPLAVAGGILSVGNAEDRLFAAACLLATLLATSGCTVCRQAKRTLCTEPLRYSAAVDRKRSLETYRSWAERAWMQECQTCGSMPTSDTYKAGFSDGFTDYVYAGGTGEPPPAPPREFWNLCERSPAGAAAANNWFAGYRHGARVARDGGYRQRGVVITSMMPRDEELRADDGLLMTPEGMGGTAPPSFEGEVLGPALEDGAGMEGADPAELPSPPAAIEQPESNPSDESSGELPIPPPRASDESSQKSASAFKSALLHAAERHRTISTAPLTAGDSVEPAIASEPILSETESADLPSPNSLRARTQTD
jgi:hypothetical protein